MQWVATLSIMILAISLPWLLLLKGAFDEKSFSDDLLFSSDLCLGSLCTVDTKGSEYLPTEWEIDIFHFCRLIHTQSKTIDCRTRRCDDLTIRCVGADMARR